MCDLRELIKQLFSDDYREGKNSELFKITVIWCIQPDFDKIQRFLLFPQRGSFAFLEFSSILVI
jgi:hypothetical protein